MSSTRLLLTHRDGEDPAKAMATDVSLATTHTVAQRVIDLLKLPETPDDLLKQYTATALTDRVLEIKVGAEDQRRGHQAGHGGRPDLPDLPQGADRAAGRRRCAATSPRPRPP